MKLSQRIAQLLNALNQNVYEKEEAIKLAFLSAITGESIFLLGAPGVAKSLIARRLKFAFADSQSFEYLMNRFSTPDEIFGPVSIQKLKSEDKYERLTENYLPNAQIVFLDEIWKANPSIQNALLTILNEKKYRNGTQEMDCDIRGLISASNELPEKEQGLEALWDRFLIRYNVEAVKETDNFNKMISEKLNAYADTVSDELKIKEDEYKAWSQEIDEVHILDEVFKVIHYVRTKIQNYNEQNVENPIYISDRRWRKIIRILRGSAFLNGRSKIDLMDCFLIPFCLWNELEQLEFMQEMVAEVIKEHGYALNLNLNVIRTQINEFEINEVKNATEIIHEYEREEFHEVVKGYYEVIGLRNNQSYNKIKVSDYKRISTSNQSFTFYSDVKSGNSHTMSAYFEGNSLRIASHQWDTCTIKTHIIKYSEVEIKAPTQMLKKIWDKHVLELTDLIQSNIKQIERHKENDLGHLKTNLFVNPDLATIVEHNLNQTIQELQQMKIQVEKIKDYYDNLK